LFGEDEGGENGEDLSLEKDEKDEEIDTLLDEIYALKSELVDAEGRVAVVESAVRAEVCAEMEAQLGTMDREWMERVAQTKASLNKKFETKMKLFQMQLQSKLDDNGKLAVDAVLDAERRTQLIVTEVPLSLCLFVSIATCALRPDQHSSCLISNCFLSSSCSA
jgi:hypothetical protein